MAVARNALGAHGLRFSQKNALAEAALPLHWCRIGRVANAPGGGSLAFGHAIFTAALVAGKVVAAAKPAGCEHLAAASADAAGLCPQRPGAHAAQQAQRPEGASAAQRWDGTDGHGARSLNG